MKRFENNEIEVLLRNLAKTERAKASRSSVQNPTSEHLDPDELNSFAEGRLPAATRSFYMAHLATCDRCRSIVAHLATTSGVASAITEPLAKQSFWTFLRKFFSPTVMRYAMPALAVVVMAVAIFVWLQRESATRIAQRENTGSAAQVVNNTPNAAPEDRASSTSPESSQTSAAKTGRVSEAKREKPADDAPAVARETRAAKSSDEARTADTASAAGAGAAATPTPAKETEAYAPPPPAKAAPQAEEEVTRTADEAERKRRPAPAPSEAVARDEQTADKNKAGKKSASGLGNARIGGLLADQKVATRSVGVRNFRRIDNVWVDTAYTSSTATININRGSEQYRALIGDEPGLRTIAEQLSGEVVVVWKGKAYRIR